MSNKIINKQQPLVVDCFQIELDRVVIFVRETSEINALRQLNLHHFEYTIRNCEQGTISHFFFLKNINFELIEIENRELTVQYSAINKIDLLARTYWQQNQAIPFGLVFRYASDSKHQSRRRCNRAERLDRDRTQLASQINFSWENFNKLEEPVCCIVPDFLTAERLLDSTSIIKQKLLAYYSQTSEIMDLRLTVKTKTSWSDTLSLINKLNLVTIKRGDVPKLELKLNNNRARRIIEFNSLPLVFDY